MLNLPLSPCEWKETLRIIVNVNKRVTTTATAEVIWILQDGNTKNRTEAIGM